MNAKCIKKEPYQTFAFCTVFRSKNVIGFVDFLLEETKSIWQIKNFTLAYKRQWDRVCPYVWYLMSTSNGVVSMLKKVNSDKFTIYIFMIFYREIVKTKVIKNNWLYEYVTFTRRTAFIFFMYNCRFWAI